VPKVQKTPIYQGFLAPFQSRLFAFSALKIGQKNFEKFLIFDSILTPKTGFLSPN